MSSTGSAQRKLPHARILIYSHDTYGLGHLRRCHTIAHDLVRRFKGLSVLILTGSPIIGRFDFGARVDFVRIPGIIKLYNGEYTSLALHIDLDETLAMRRSIIYSTAKSFKPDIFLVDKEPLGLKGEVESTLEMLKKRHTTTILGLRDILDEQQSLTDEWEKKGVFPQLERLYDHYWIYGNRALSDSLQGLPVATEVIQKCKFTGYLHRTTPPNLNVSPPLPDSPYLLVTPGGGGDGCEMVDAVLRAYESGQALPWPAMIVLGPFMPLAERQAFTERAEKISKVTMHTFHNHLEALISNASAVVAMGGYNTFCEILSFKRPALIIPRIKPRQEQYIRASRATSEGLVSMLHPADLQDINRVIQAIKNLAQQPAPDLNKHPGLLDGLDFIAAEVERIITQP